MTTTTATVPAPCDPGDVDLLLGRIRAVAPGVLAVSLDHAGARPRATLEKERRRLHLHLDGLPRSGRAGSVPGALPKFAGTDPAATRELVDCLAALATLNPYGAWCVVAVEGTGDRLSAIRNPGAQGHGQALLAAVRADLQRSMPQLADIRATTFGDAARAGPARRRLFLRCFDNDGRERASLDTAHFSTHVAALLLDNGDYAEMNRARAAVWARQLGVEAIDLPTVLQQLGLLFSTLRLSRVDLRERGLRSRGVPPCRWPAPVGSAIRSSPSSR